MKIKALAPILLPLAALAVAVSSTLAAPTDKTTTPEEARAQLDAALGEIRTIEPWVERPILGRFTVLKSTIQYALDSLNQNGLGHRATFQAYQNIIVRFRFSQSILSDEIETPRIAPNVARLKAFVEDITRQFGFDDSPYTQITRSVFSQIHALLLQIETLPVDAALKEKLIALKAPVGETMAIAVTGDRPRTFEKATDTLLKIRKIYPMLDQLSRGQIGFNAVLEIQGLAEFYAEFAQVDRGE